MVGNVLGEDHEGHGHIGGDQGDKVAQAQLTEGAGALQNGEPGHGDQGLQAEGGKAVHKGLEVDDLEHVVAGGVAHQIEHAGAGVARQDAQDEGDQPGHLLAEGGHQHRGEQGDQAADQAHVDRTRGGVHYALHNGGDAVAHLNGVLHHLLGDAALEQVRHRVGGQRQADDGHRGPDDHRGHQLAQPVGAQGLGEHCQDHINQARQCRAENQTQIPETDTCGACKGGAH